MKKIFILLFSLLLSTPLFAGQIKEIVFLGDSLSDNGNLYRLLKVVPKSPPYYQGRFTNGLVWAEHVGQHFSELNNIQVENFAYGGATTILHEKSNDAFIAPITLDGEIYSYIIHSLNTPNKSAILFSLWIGSNDYLYDLNPDTETLTNNVIDKISAGLETLIKQGAQNFLLINVPDLSRIPFAKKNHLSNRLHTLSVTHNKKLALAIEQIKLKYPSTHIALIDIYTVLNDLIDHPDYYNSQYGVHLQNTSQSCWQGGMSLTSMISSPAISPFIVNSPMLAEAYKVGLAYQNGEQPCTNPDEYIFWDEMHPTALVHQILGQLAIQTIGEADLLGLNAVTD